MEIQTECSAKKLPCLACDRCNDPMESTRRSEGTRSSPFARLACRPYYSIFAFITLGHMTETSEKGTRLEDVVKEYHFLQLPGRSLTSASPKGLRGNHSRTQSLGVEASGSPKRSPSFVDDSHVERISTFVRRHRQESLTRKKSWMGEMGAVSVSKGDSDSGLSSKGMQHQISANVRSGSRSGSQIDLHQVPLKIPNLSSLSVSPGQQGIITPTVASPIMEVEDVPVKLQHDPSSLSLKSGTPELLLETPCFPRTELYARHYDPETFASLLFTGSYDLTVIDNLVELLTRKDAYHCSVLHSYMDLFDLTNLGLDEAFRRVCGKLDIAGETQVMDRILYQIARRYWDCNEAHQNLYKSIGKYFVKVIALVPTHIWADIAYGILFSLVLLNTDLHIANTGDNKSRQMSKKEFLKNTTDLVDSMTKKDEGLKQSLKMGDSKKKWRKELDVLLKDYYEKIRECPLIEKEAEFVTAHEPERRLSRTSSTWSVSSGMSTGSMFSSSSATSSRTNGGFGIFRRKLFGQSGQFSSSDPKAAFSFHVDGKECAYQGMAIRKHLLEKGNQRARHRRWQKLFCVLLYSNEGVELVMSRLDPSKSQGPLSRENVSVSADSPLSSSSPASRSKPPIPASEPTSLSLSSFASETFNVLHSVTQALKPMSYSSKRPFVFSLQLSNGNTFLFHVQSNIIMKEWVEALNYQVARKSKEPLRDVLSSTDYGWNVIEWAWKKAELEKRVFDTDSFIAQQKAENGDRLPTLKDWEPPSCSFGPVLVSNLSDVRLP